jgi:hypothetical protein
MTIIGPHPADEKVADAANPSLNNPQFQGPECLVAPAAVA